MNLATYGKYYPLQVLNKKGQLLTFYLVASNYKEALQKSKLPSTENEQERLQFFIKTYKYLRLSFECFNEEKVEKNKWLFEASVREALVRTFYRYIESECQDSEWDVETMIIDLIEELFLKQISNK